MPSELEALGTASRVRFYNPTLGADIDLTAETGAKCRWIDKATTGTVVLVGLDDVEVTYPDGWTKPIICAFKTLKNTSTCTQVAVYW